MSKENLQAFYQEYRTNLELQEQLQSTTNTEEFVNKAVALGASKDFDFTVAEVEAALADPSAFLEESIGEELKDVELFQVVAGTNLPEGLKDIIGGIAIFCQKDNV